ncbi:MAG: hypothetical protein ACTSX6_04835 [Candidatus Heimdallarchaeaceae archaeon]
MNKADKLLEVGENISFEVKGEKVEFMIKPLKNKELLEIMKLAENQDTESMMLKMVFYSLHKDDPSFTMDQVRELPYLFDFLKVITKVNHLEDLFDFQAREGRRKSDPNQISVPKLNKNTFVVGNSPRQALPPLR